jgi:ankyrin repeat protein
LQLLVRGVISRWCAYFWTKLNGALLNNVDSFGKTPLYIACAHGFVDIVGLLLSRGADASLCDQSGVGPFAAVAIPFLRRFIRFLIERQPDLDLTQYPELLLLAWQYGHLDSVKLLLEKFSYVNTADVNLAAALLTSAEWGYVDIARLLIDNEVDINTVDTTGRTPLSLAVAHGHTELATVLIDRGADVNIVDDAGQSSLHSAMSRGLVDIARLLVDSGADVNISNLEGYCPLYLAIAYGHTELAAILIERGADVNRITDGYTPLYVACYFNHWDLAVILVKRSHYDPSPLALITAIWKSAPLKYSFGLSLYLLGSKFIQLGYSKPVLVCLCAAYMLRIANASAVPTFTAYFLKYNIELVAFMIVYVVAEKTRMALFGRKIEREAH